MAHLAVGDKGIDYSSHRLTPPNVAVSAGAKFILRYSAGIASRPSHSSYNAVRAKLITPGEYAQLKPLYIVLANSEWYEGRITEGRNAGYADGQADFELWRSCGYPQGWPLFCSWDRWPTQAEVPAVAEYLRGHQAGMDKAAGTPRYYVADLYAGERGVREIQKLGLAPLGWLSMAWHDGLGHNAALVQTGTYWFGNQADENVMRRAVTLGGATTGDGDFLMALTDAEQKELLDNSRKARDGVAVLKQAVYYSHQLLRFAAEKTGAVYQCEIGGTMFWVQSGKDLGVAEATYKTIGYKSTLYDVPVGVGRQAYGVLVGPDPNDAKKVASYAELRAGAEEWHASEEGQAHVASLTEATGGGKHAEDS